MSDTLKSILSFTGIPIGGTQTLPHGLVINGTALKPDHAHPQFPNDFAVVAADTTNLTIRNVTNAVGDCQVLVEAWAPVERMFGKHPDDGTFSQHLTPQPFSTSPSGGSPPFPPTPPVVTTIFVRTTGSDTTGTGTLAKPYRTVQRAFLDIPLFVPPGFAYLIDNTGCSGEAIPAGYQPPAIQGTQQLVRFGDPADLPFLTLCVVTVRATPEPFAGIPLADTTVLGSDIVSIAANPATGLAIVTVATPRASWAANALRGAKVIGGGTNASTSCEIYGSDATHIQLCNTVAAVPQQDLFIVQPSAGFVAAGVGTDGGGFTVDNVSSIAFQGQSFAVTGGGSDSAAALVFINTPQPFVELCDIDSLGALDVPLQMGLFSSKVTSFLTAQASALTPRRSLIQGAGFSITGCNTQVFRQTVLIGCGPLGPGTFATTIAAGIQSGWELAQCLLTESTGDGIQARGSWALEDVEIADSAGDAISASGPSLIALTHVTGTANAGFGVHVTDGAQALVTDNGTLVTGTDGDMKVGTLPARTWTDFRTLVPTKNQYDLQTPFVTNVASGLSTPGGDDVTGAGTGGCSGSRLYQRT